MAARHPDRPAPSPLNRIDLSSVSVAANALPEAGGPDLARWPEYWMVPKPKDVQATTVDASGALFGSAAGRIGAIDYLPEPLTESDTIVETLFDTLDQQMPPMVPPSARRNGRWSSPQPNDQSPLTPERLEAEFGIPKINQHRFRMLSDRFGVVFDVRPTNPDSVRWLEAGAVPKPEEIKAKTVNTWDTYLGAARADIGLVGYFDPVLPDVEPLTPEVSGKVAQRFANRRREHTELASGMAQLAEQGRYRVHRGVVQLRTPSGFKHITGDHDVFHIRRPEDGLSLSTADYDDVVWLLTHRNMGVQHGAHKYWVPQGSFQQRIYDDIVQRHQADFADNEPLIRFSPGEPTSLVYADPTPDEDAARQVGIVDWGRHPGGEAVHPLRRNLGLVRHYRRWLTPA